MSLTLTTVRYYTQADPYYYTVDNRPLSDLEARDTQILNEMNNRVKMVRATGSATPVLNYGPTGWTIALNGTGDYTITHNMATANFTVVAGLAATAGFATVFSQDSTTIRIKTFNTANAAAHFNFNLMVSIDAA
jgi:fructose-1-phosphate kinase PfkB-like protein